MQVRSRSRRFRPTLDALSERVSPANMIVAPTDGVILAPPPCTSTPVVVTPTDGVLIGWTPDTVTP
jgi:hypothetical protein